MACHVPSASFPSRTGAVQAGPFRAVLMCESELPSACSKADSFGTIEARWVSMSLATSGSAPSLIVTPAVVWGMNTWHTPSPTRAFATASATRAVTSTSCVRRLVCTEKLTQLTGSGYYARVLLMCGDAPGAPGRQPHRPAGDHAGGAPARGTQPLHAAGGPALRSHPARPSLPAHPLRHPGRRSV